jgi:DNA-binding NarL/FixJ family response regulator
MTQSYSSYSSMKIKVLIVDDEPLARKGVALRLREESDMEIVGMCSNGKLAVQRIQELAPDLVFLDIQMPLMSGIEVMRARWRDRRLANDSRCEAARNWLLLRLPVSIG